MVTQRITAKLPAITRPLRVFGLIWFGQLISLMGSGLTGFALGVWVYQRTGSVTQYAFITLSATLPAILTSPLAGVLVDRWNRRSVMLFSDTGAALSTLGIALLLWSGRLEIWHIYLTTAVSSTFSALQWPAYAAAISQVVPKQHLGRASGMVQSGQAAGQIISPLLAGVLIGSIGLQGVIVIDLATFLFSLTTLLLVRIPKPETTLEGAAAKGSLWREATYGWHYITARSGLLGLLLFFAIINFSTSLVEVLITPLVLGFGSAAMLGVVLSVAGCGMLIGTLLMSMWGGPKRRVHGILGFTLVQGMVLFLGGLRPSELLVASAAFVFLFNTPIIQGCSQAIWQSKVELDVQGRVFAIRVMIAWSTAPLAYLAAGPLVDRIFEPLLAVKGPLSGSLGLLIGVGQGRGIGLLFITLGLVTVLATLGGYLYPRLRLVEDELPDALVKASSAVAKSAVEITSPV